MTSLFEGELMRCGECGFSQQSDPSIESGWYLVAIEEEKGYICPRCAGNRQCPKCKKCDRFYHEKYKQCPWCKPKRGFGQ
jgi:RNA polymerase subunit RPABC4/transcription elongation factor Spt4